MIQLQPCDWLEFDNNFKYNVDVFGRLADNRVARLRLTGFSPYFYLRADPSETPAIVYTALEQATGKRLIGLKIEQELKLDAMRGFNALSPTKVWKLIFPALWMMKQVTRVLKGHCRIGSRVIQTEDIYESNLPPYIRLFHELDLFPASPLEFEAEEEDPDEDTNVDVCFVCDYKTIKPCPSANIPLYAMAYDLETYSDNGNFPVATNPSNEIMQIGLSFRYTSDLMKSVKRMVLVSGKCTDSKDPDVKFIACKDEKDLLEQFQKVLHFENPDIIAGYNTFGFDDGYIAERARITKTHLMLGRTDPNSWKRDFAKTESKTFELASGKFAVRYLEVHGRLGIDLLLSIRREQNLDSYKLDNVSSTFLRDKVLAVEPIDDTHTQIFTKNTRGMFVGNMVRFDIVTNTVNPYMNGKKFVVERIDKKSFVIRHEIPILDEDITDDEFDRLEWSFSKDDITAQEMWDSHTGTPDQRAKVAKYCVQDCDLVLTLMAKLDTIVNARGMADVCRVPIQYIFLRGQGIKIYSAVVYNASKRNQIIMTQDNVEGDTSYEGAIVLPPKIGMYLDQPIPVLDFNSLYPSNMIAFNLSPDTLVYVKTFNADGKKLRQEGTDPEYIKSLGYTIDEIGYDTKNDSGESTGRIICGFVQPKAEDPRTVGVLPLTLDILLKKRKETRKLMETTEDDSQKSVLNGLQLAYKVVANSVYGQSGSRTSPIRRLEVAACTTAAGRDRIQFAKSIIETEFGGNIVYGDTDSVFIRFATKDLRESIELAKKAANRITELCRRPYKIEYEKTFYPFILFCRKRYVGMMYEDDVTKCYRKTMGIALKRRDNAPIVKDVFGGALDILLEKRDIRAAQTFVKDMLVRVMKNEIPIEKYIVTKQLRDDYITDVPPQIRNHNSKGKPYELNNAKASFNIIKEYAVKYDLELPASSIAHRVLADRMEERDKGTAPQVGDRVPYVYVSNRSDAKKQGDKIEHVDYVKAKGLKPDTEFYITNQIQNPVAQLFALAIEDLEGYKPRVDYAKLYRETLDKGIDEEEATLAILKRKEKELESILFMGASYLTKHKRGAMDAFVIRK